VAALEAYRISLALLVKVAAVVVLGLMNYSCYFACSDVGEEVSLLRLDLGLAS
jgi:hypothetical protein